ncbi:hypothetical protein QYE76_033797 [Lolium multiflorum]|uniref:Uncharacterized protein n=1 Tax=Lolium multiflorum TaxID=4521 RepID=A0AAD8QZD0_LOLMU|nr:hypothetical protein QYE76_033797 [Lolium multiflorum]
MVDGGTEGLEGYARVIMPRITPCFERNIWIFSPYIKFPLCTFAKTQSTAAHCIEYARFIKWDKFTGKPFDADDAEHMQWIYSEVCSTVMTCNLGSAILSQSNFPFTHVHALKRT